MGKKAEERKAAKVATERRNKRATVFTIIGLAAGFGCPAYFMFAANPAFYAGVALLLLAALFFWIAILEFFRSWKIKVILTLIVVGCSWWSILWAKQQWKEKILADIDAGILINIAVPTSGDLWESVINVKNTSKQLIDSHFVECHINEITYVTPLRGKLHDADVHWDIPETLEPNGDGRAAGCLFFQGGGRLLRVPSPVDCADVIVTVGYSSNRASNIEGKKRLRFVTNVGSAHLWVQQPINRVGSYCSP